MRWSGFGGTCSCVHVIHAHACIYIIIMGTELRHTNTFTYMSKDEGGCVGTEAEEMNFYHYGVIYFLHVYFSPHGVFCH